MGIQLLVLHEAFTMRHKHLPLTLNSPVDSSLDCYGLHSSYLYKYDTLAQASSGSGSIVKWN